MIIIMYNERVGITFLTNPTPTFPPARQEDVIALKRKTGESSIKDAIAQAVYHYLKCQKTDDGAS